jgi:NAD(P)-dependent dehydrogenase (short-subunit alcohol dehydrogenase family)
VTGASAGIGRATALAFARRGWALGLIARGADRLKATVDEIRQLGGRAVAVRADVANADDVAAAAAEIASTFGRIDVWVNNAMVTVYSPATELTPAEIRRVTEVTFLGQAHGTLAALRYMREQRRGTIVQIGSALAYRSIPLQSAYCAAKAAVRGFTDSLRSELHHEGSPIRLTMVQLPAVDTPQFDWARSRLPRRLQPVPPIYAPEAVAETIVRAAIEGPRELWVGGPTIRAIMGNAVMPGTLDRIAARKAWKGQMTDEPSRSRPDNLFTAPPGDPGAHGRFGDRSRTRLVSMSDAGVRGFFAAAAFGALAGAATFGWWLASRPGKAPNRRLTARERAARLIA